MRPFRLTAVIAAILAVGSCSGFGPDEGPLARRFGWFPYIDGADIRKSCRDGAPDRWRIVYNGVYGQHVRTYDIIAHSPGSPSAPAATMVSEVLTPLAMGEFRVDFPVQNTGARVPTGLSGAEYGALVAAVAASGFFGAPPVGTTLKSDRYYWVVTACTGGRFHFNAWLYPSPRYEEIRFIAPLLRHDATGVPYQPPESEEERLRFPQLSEEERFRRGEPVFTFVVGRDHLRGAGTLF